MTRICGTALDAKPMDEAEKRRLKKLGKKLVEEKP
jgi:hypothetical protein